MSAPTLKELGQALPVRVPRAPEVDALRRALLDETARLPPKRRVRPLWMGAAAAMLFIVGGIAATRTLRPRPRPQDPAEVVALGAADYDRSGSAPGSNAGDDVVQLRAGRLRLHGAHVRVVAKDAELEVAGGRLEVLAASDGLEEIVVEEGRVTLRRPGTGAVVLEAGAVWKRSPVAHAPAAAVQPPVASIAPRSQPSAPRAEAAFATGWEALRSGDAHAAAVSFHAARADRTGALREDAAYWEGVALARSGEGTAAVRAMRAFLSEYPRSARAGELSVMLGWLLVDQGEATEARERFEAGAADLDSRVRESAQAGLSKLGR